MLLPKIIPKPFRRKHVTNAFRPVVVLLHDLSNAQCIPSPDVTNAFRPVVVLLQAIGDGGRALGPRHQCLSAGCGVVTPQIFTSRAAACPVTNAFRPVVVLLRVQWRSTHKGGQRSPMPFGRLWCCYKTELPKLACLALSHQCLSAGCGVVTLVKLVDPVEAIKRHQCLSAGCGVVTQFNSTRGLRGRKGPKGWEPVSFFSKARRGRADATNSAKTREK